MIMYRSPVLNDMVYHFAGAPGQEINIYVEDLEGRMQFFGHDFANQDGLLDIHMDVLQNYDRTVAMTITDMNGNVLVQESITIVRPYYLQPLIDAWAEAEKLRTQAKAETDPAKASDLNTRADKIIADARLKEAMVRTTIDSITGGFYLRRKVISYDALGGDALPLESGIIRIIRAWQNGVLVYQNNVAGFRNMVDFIISRDRTAILIDNGDLYRNRLYGNDPALPWAPSDRYGYGWDDSWGYGNRYGSIVRRSHYSGEFMAGTDFEFDVEYGYRTIPGDIEFAAQLLFNDPTCMNTYLNNYIVEYDTDQYRIKYDSGALKGTGNRKVDAILGRYASSGGSLRVGVL